MLRFYFFFLSAINKLRHRVEGIIFSSVWRRILDAEVFSFKAALRPESTSFSWVKKSKKMYPRIMTKKNNNRRALCWPTQ